MKKHNITKDIIYKEDNGIIIRLDRKKAKRIKKATKQECVALWEERMGYGIYITQNETVGVYADDFFHKEVLSKFWDMFEEQFNKDLDNAEDVNECVAIAMAILVTCSNALADQGIDNLDRLLAA